MPLRIGPRRPRAVLLGLAFAACVFSVGRGSRPPGPRNTSRGRPIGRGTPFPRFRRGRTHAPAIAPELLGTLETDLFLPSPFSLARSLPKYGAHRCARVRMS